MDLTQFAEVLRPNKVISLHNSRFTDLGCRITTAKRVCEGNIVEDIVMEVPDEDQEE